MLVILSCMLGRVVSLLWWEHSWTMFYCQYSNTFFDLPNRQFHMAHVMEIPGFTENFESIILLCLGVTSLKFTCLNSRMVNWLFSKQIYKLERKDTLFFLSSTLGLCHLQKQHDHPWEPGHLGLGTQHEVMDLTNVVYSIPVIEARQPHCAFKWESLLYTFIIFYKVMKTCLLVAEHSLTLRGHVLLSIR